LVAGAGCAEFLPGENRLVEGFNSSGPSPEYPAFTAASIALEAGGVGFVGDVGAKFELVNWATRFA
jgi:hypothetical protein